MSHWDMILTVTFLFHVSGNDYMESSSHFLLVVPQK